MKRLVVVSAFLLFLITGAAWAGDEPQGSSHVYITVLKAANGKPVRNASVVLHPVKENGKQSGGGAQLKTSQEGKTEYPGIPYGKWRIQVIAPGFRTYGDDFVINQPQQEIVIKLEKPGEQHSIYK